MPPKLKKESSVLDSTSTAIFSERHVWPEWTDAEINAEKWDAGAKKGEKGKPSTPVYFEDPEGQPILPESLAGVCQQWKRIPELYSNGGGIAVFEEQNAQKPLSILHSNSHLLFSPFIRSLIGSICSLQDFCVETEGLEDWRPWSLVFSMNKTGGKEHRPLVNPNGKYVVKLYWIGKWRKVVIDDSIPCDVNGAPLLITSSNTNEIWPLIISKAILKLATISLSPRNREIPEFSIITTLTGWIHEVLNGSCSSTWKLLNQYLPIFSPESPQVNPTEDAKTKDKKDKKKKDDSAVPSKMMAFCLAELEHGEADLHPCQIIKVRDRPLRPPSPPPVIPRWKLIRPRPDVLQQLEDMERSKIPDRWCYVRSALKVSSAEDVDESTSMPDLDKNDKSVSDCDWMRIEDITQLESSRIHIYHRTNNPGQKAIHEHHITATDSIITNDLHTQFFFADMIDDSQDIIVSFQVQNRKIDRGYAAGIKGAKTPASTPPTPIMDDQGNAGGSEVLATSEDRPSSVDVAASPMHLLDTELASASSSTLRIQDYSLKKYYQTTTDVIKNESYSQGSVRFRLPKGRTVLRFQLQAAYASTMTVLFEARNQNNINFGPLDQIVPFGGRFPFSWRAHGNELLAAVRESIQSLGNRDSLQTAIRKLATLTENSEVHWMALRQSFYRLASTVLGDSAIPGDLGALRLAFRDHLPSLGPQPYFPNVKNGLTTEATDIAELEKMDMDMASVQSLTAASLIARNWRGFAARQHFDALTGNSPGAQRRQESAMERFEELYAKFDESTVEIFIKYYMEEMNWPDVEIKSLSADGDQSYALSTLSGKIPPVLEGWNVLFRERLNIKHKVELFPLFTEYGLDKNYRTRIRLLDSRGAPIGQILRRVSPSTVQPGFYTLIGEIEGTEIADAPSGSWKLQLISNVTSPNLISEHESGFNVRVERGPYLPPAPSTFEPGLLFRYNIGVSAALSASFHLTANNPSAQLKLILKDGSDIVYACGGEASILIPSWHLTPAPSSSTPSVASLADKQLSRSNSRIGKNKKSSNTSVDSSVEVMQYSLEGHCVGNWNLTPSEEAAVAKLRIDAENEIRVFGKIGSSSTHSDVGGSKGSSRARSMSKVPSPETSETATWTLRVFLDSDMSDNIELKPDNQRKEKIRAMKLAWEAAEEGRHKKGYEARSSYLQSIEGNEQDLNTLLAQTKRGSLKENPEVAVAKFREMREATQEYCQNEEKQRQEELERVTKQYEELAEREQVVFQQIQYSMNAASTLSV